MEKGVPVPFLVFLWLTVLRLLSALLGIMYYIFYYIPKTLFLLPVNAWYRWWPTSVTLVICLVALCWVVGGVCIAVVWTLRNNLNNGLRIFLTVLLTGVLVLFVPGYLGGIRKIVQRKKDRRQSQQRR